VVLMALFKKNFSNKRFDKVKQIIGSELKVVEEALKKHEEYRKSMHGRDYHPAGEWSELQEKESKIYYELAEKLKELASGIENGNI
jgi:hypothetical protein